MAYFVECIKSKSNIESIKQFLLQNGFLDKNQRFINEKSALYFPIHYSKGFVNQLKNKFPNVSIVEKEIIQKGNTDFKTALEEVLPKNKLSFVKTAFDTVGTIAILEIDPELMEYDHLIGKTLLSINNNIKTVVRKDGIHSGVFRTQKLVHLAGIDTKETLYKENGISLKLNPEEVYFSPRLSTERKRINSLIKPNENVLVMFSGCGPYPANIAKNTDAKYITGIEINPTAYNYSLENMRINHINNVILHNGDVKEIIPQLKNAFLGLKSHWNIDHLNERIKANPNIIEFYIEANDLDTSYKSIKESINYVASKNIMIYLHMPHLSTHTVPSFTNNSADETIAKLFKLQQLASHYAVKGIILHPIDNGEDINEFITKFNSIKDKLNLRKIYFENVPFKGFATIDEINNVLEKTGVMNICLDVSHSYIYTKDESAFIDLIKNVNASKKYFHIMDSKGVIFTEDPTKDHMSLGTGDINHNLYLPYIDEGIIEVDEDDYMYPIKGISSLETIRTSLPMPTYNRIVMPLPKSAEDFLVDAFKVSKKGTIIHLYDFVDKDDFPQTTLANIDSVCKEKGFSYKVLNSVKCGQYSPSKYRVCVDFQII